MFIGSCEWFPGFFFFFFFSWSWWWCFLGSRGVGGDGKWIFVSDEEYSVCRSCWR